MEIHRFLVLMHNSGEKELNIVRENKLGFIDIKVPKNKNLDEYANELQKMGLFDVVEFNSYGEYHELNPNDTDILQQWHLETINMPDAWDISTGCSSIIVGILDSGVDWEHEDIGTGTDLYQNIFLNAGEDTWTDVNDPTSGNGVDDDGNGLIDDWKGWNYSMNSNDSRPTFYHGTFVSGIAGAKTNNNTGIAGVAGGNNHVGVRLLPYHIGDTPDGSILDDAINDAVENGARVIQLSLSVAPTSAINTAIQNAVNNDVVVVCSSGNLYSSSVGYPASNSNVIAVGAINVDNTRAGFSNYGTQLDLVAPGVDIYSTMPNDNYETREGTSFAAPQVSAIAALILSINPNLTQDQVRNIIESTCTKVGSYDYATTTGRANGTWDDEVGYGCVNAFAAVSAVIDQFTVTGPSSSIVCYSGSTFTASNAPTCSSIDWTTSDNLYVESGDTTLTPTIRGWTSTSSGSGWAQINYVLDGNTTAGPRINVWVGPPSKNDFNIFDMETDDNLLFEGEGNSLMAQDNSSYPVQMGITDWDWDFGDWWRITLYEADNYIANIYPDDGFYYQDIGIRAENVCGESSWYYERFYSFDSYYLSIYPNPASDYIELLIEPEETAADKTSKVKIEKANGTDGFGEYSVEIWSKKGGFIKKIKSKEMHQQISTRDLPEGIYFVHLKVNGKTYKQQLSIRK